jgi:hypothetical protein
MAYSIKSDAKDFELLWLFLVMIFSFWTASAKFDDAFKNNMLKTVSKHMITEFAISTIAEQIGVKHNPPIQNN